MVEQRWQDRNIRSNFDILVRHDMLEMTCAYWEENFAVSKYFAMRDANVFLSTRFDVLLSEWTTLFVHKACQS